MVVVCVVSCMRRGTIRPCSFRANCLEVRRAHTQGDMEHRGSVAFLSSSPVGYFVGTHWMDSLRKGWNISAWPGQFSSCFLVRFWWLLLWPALWGWARLPRVETYPVPDLVSSLALLCLTPLLYCRCFLGASHTWPHTFLMSEPTPRGIQLKTQPLENRCLPLYAHLSVSMHFLWTHHVEG